MEYEDPYYMNIWLEESGEILDRQFDPNKQAFRFILLSPEDEHLRASVTTIDRNGYAICGRRPLHRIILPGSSTSLHVDHINQNKLDNRRENLRYLTPTENCLNARQRKNNLSGVKGIHWHTLNKRWQAMGSGQHLYYGLDFFEACCARKSWENKRSFI